MPNIATVDSHIASVVAKNGWLNHPFLKFDDHEGFISYSFGFRAGPSYDIFNFLHEVAHAIELSNGEIARLRINNYGLAFADSAYVYVYGASFCEPKTMQASERECRVFAIQRHITETLAQPVMPTFFEDNAKTLVKYMADYRHGGATDDDRIQNCVTLMQSHYDNITMAGIRERWHTAMEYIKTQILNTGK